MSLISRDRKIAKTLKALIPAEEDRVDHQAFNEQEAREAALGKDVARTSRANAGSPAPPRAVARAMRVPMTSLT